MDLKTTYLGLALPHPFIVGASPVADAVDSAKAAEDAGAAAIVMRSLFEEQLDAEFLAMVSATEDHADTYAEASNYLPHYGLTPGPEETLENLRRMKESLSIPVFASLNGYTPRGWLDHAKRLEQAGADALELNVFRVVADPERSSEMVEDDVVAMVRRVVDAVELPVAVKLSPFYTALPHLARRLVDAGASGLVLFNRFFGPDIDVEAFEVVPELRLSGPHELLLRLRWLAILSGTMKTSLAVTGGVHDGLGAVKAIMAGAHAVQMVSAVLQGGPSVLTRSRDELATWLEEHEYPSLAVMRGCMDVSRCPDARAYRRANYTRLLATWRR